MDKEGNHPAEYRRDEVEPYRGLARYILAIFQKYAICSILAYPFKPQPLKNVPNHDMVPLQAGVGATIGSFLVGIQV